MTESRSLQHQSVPTHGPRTQDDGQVLIVHDVLPHGGDDPPGLLEELLPSPPRVQPVEAPLNVVMYPHEDHVHARQRHVLVHSLITL